MSDKILIEYQVEVDGLKASMKEVQKSMKETEDAGVHGGKNIGNEFDKVGEKTKSLKAQLRELKAQLANTTDPKEFNRLAAAAGKVQDKINDASDATKAFAKESKASTAKTLFSQILGDLSQLDFKGAADKARQFAAVMSSITLAETIGGLKSLGSAILDVGKALFSNPLFILAATLATIAKVGYDVVKSFLSITTQTVALTEAINESKKSILDYQNKFLEAQIKIRESLGVYTKYQADLKREDLKNNKERLDLQEKYKNALIKIAQETGVDLNKINKQGFVDGEKLYSNSQQQFVTVFTNEEKRFNLERTKLQSQYLKESAELLKKSSQEKLAITTLSTKEVADKTDALEEKIANEIAANNAKKLAENKAFNDEILKQAIELRDLQASLIEDEKSKELAILNNKFTDLRAAHKGQNEYLLALEEKYRQERDVIIKKYFDAEVERQVKYDNIRLEAQTKLDNELDAQLDANITNTLNKTLAAKEELYNAEIAAEKQKQDVINAIRQSGFQLASDLASSYAQIQQNNIQSQIQNVNDAKDAEIAALDEQLSKGLISRDNYDKKRAEAETKNRNRERQLKQQAFEAAKQASLINAAINTAQAVIGALAQTAQLGYGAFVLAALAAASGAAQIAVIESQPTPKFAKGGKVEGKLHSQGGTLIEAERDEWIIKRNESIKNDSLLDAINKGKGQKYIHEMYVAPALKEQLKKHNSSKDNDFASNIASSMMLNSGQFKDGNILESLKMQRQSDKENIKYLAKIIQQNNYNPRSW